MKLIIDIDESAYAAFKIRAERKEPVCCTENAYLIQKIIDGTPCSPIGDLISRSDLKKAIYDTDFDFGDYYDNTEEIRERVCNAIDNASTVEDEIKWHNLKENPNDKPTKLGWYCCKISSSDDLKMVFGQSEVMSGMYDAWLLVSCPY